MLSDRAGTVPGVPRQPGPLSPVPLIWSAFCLGNSGSGCPERARLRDDQAAVSRLRCASCKTCDSLNNTRTSSANTVERFLARRSSMICRCLAMRPLHSLTWRETISSSVSCLILLGVAGEVSGAPSEVTQNRAASSVLPNFVLGLSIVLPRPEPTTIVTKRFGVSLGFCSGVPRQTGPDSYAPALRCASVPAPVVPQSRNPEAASLLPRPSAVGPVQSARSTRHPVAVSCKGPTEEVPSSLWLPSEPGPAPVPASRAEQ